MKLRDDLNALTPRLRRYARALTTGHPGGCERADDLVHATLMRALGARNVGLQSDLVVRAYATLTQLHREIADTGEASRPLPAAKPASIGKQATARPLSAVVRQSKLTIGLMSLPLDDREALLLVALEGFDYGEAARILRISRGALVLRLTRARAALDAQLHVTSGVRIQAANHRPLADEPERPMSHLRLVK